MNNCRPSTTSASEFRGFLSGKSAGFRASSPRNLCARAGIVVNNTQQAISNRRIRFSIQCEGNQVVSNRKRDDLFPAAEKCNGAGEDPVASRKVPEFLAGLRIEREEIALHGTGKDEVPRSRQHARPVRR